MAKKYILRNLKLKASEPLSLVDAGANPHARVVLFKRHDEVKTQTKEPKVNWLTKFLKSDDEKIVKVSLEEIMAKLSEEEQGVLQAAIAAAAEAGKTVAEESEAVEASKEDDEEMAKEKDEEMEKEEEKDEVMKSLPAEIRKALDEAKELKSKVAKMERVEKRNAKIDEIKKSMACVPVEHGLLADTLMAAESALAADQFKALESALRGLSEVAKSSALFKETGTVGGEGGDAENRLLSIAKSIQEKTPSMNFAKALVAAAEQNPELYEETRSAK